MKKNLLLLLLLIVMGCKIPINNVDNIKKVEDIKSEKDDGLSNKIYAVYEEYTSKNRDYFDIDVEKNITEDMRMYLKSYLPQSEDEFTQSIIYWQRFSSIDVGECKIHLSYWTPKISNHFESIGFNVVVEREPMNIDDIIKLKNRIENDKLYQDVVILSWRILVETD